MSQYVQTYATLCCNKVKAARGFLSAQRERRVGAVPARVRGCGLHSVSGSPHCRRRAAVGAATGAAGTARSACPPADRPPCPLSPPAPASAHAPRRLG